MPSRYSLPIKDAEHVRKVLGLTEESFSIRLGFSSRAYYQAVHTRKKISWWMSREIANRYHHLLGIGGTP